MTKGAKAQWGAALLVAPAAAAIFVGTTAWAASHNPLKASAPEPDPTVPVALAEVTPALDSAPPQQPANAAVAGGSDPALAQQIAEHRAVVRKLQKRLARAESESVQAWQSAGASSGNSSSGGSSSTNSYSTSGSSNGSSANVNSGNGGSSNGNSSGNSSNGNSSNGSFAQQQPAPKPAPQQVQPHQPAPPTQASTGASGG